MINDFKDNCNENKNILFLQEEIICENKDCSDFIHFKNYRNYTDIQKCKNYYKKKNLEIENIVDEKLIEKCDFCQKNLNYFSR